MRILKIFTKINDIKNHVKDLKNWYPHSHIIDDSQKLGDQTDTVEKGKKNPPT